MTRSRDVRPRQRERRQESERETRSFVVEFSFLLLRTTSAVSLRWGLGGLRLCYVSKKHSNHQPPRRSIGRAGLVVPIGRVARSFRKRFLLFWSLLSYKRIYSNRCGQATQPTGPNITGRSGAKASSTPGREALDALLANAIERHRITISSHRAGAGDDDDDESNDGIESPKGCSGLRRVDFTQRPHSYCPCC